MLSFKHKRIIGSLAGTVAALLYPMSAFAQGATDLLAPETFIASIVVKILTALHMLTWILFGFLNFLLDPQFIFDTDAQGQGQFMNMLNQIWQLSRDITNLAFAVLLVFGAVYTIATAKKDFINSHIKNFMLAIILVNFSWFIPRVVLDVANVATATIFGIPSLIGQGAGSCSYKSATSAPGCTGSNGNYTCSCVLITNMQLFVDNWETLDKDSAWECPAGPLFCYKHETLQPDSVASFSAILNGLIVNHGRLREMGRIPQTLRGGSKVSELIVFLIREIILIAFHLAFFLPLLAMTIAFFIRIPVLWITIAFMPFAFLSPLLPASLKKFPDMIRDYFLKAAFLPAMVAIPLAIGFIMVNAGAQLSSPASQAASQIQINLFPGASNLWDLLWMCMSFGILWAGVFMVLKEQGGIMATGAEKIESFGKSSAKLAGNLALATPLPIPGGSILQAATKFNPEAMNYALKNGGWDGLKDMLAGNRASKVQASGEKLRSDQLPDFKRNMDALKRAIERGNQSDQADALRNLQNMGADIQDPAELADYLKGVEKNKDLSATEIRDTKTLIEEVRKASPSAPPPTDPKTAGFNNAATNLASDTNLRNDFNRLLDELKTLQDNNDDPGAAAKVAEINNRLNIQIDATDASTAKQDLLQLLNSIGASSMPMADKTGLQTKVRNLKG